jgi:recombination protein RecR
MQYPKVFEDLIEDFKKLPGVGEKTAERYAFIINSLKNEDIEKFSNDLIEFKKNIKHCKICGILTDKDVCEICASKSRNDSIICVVEDSKNAYIFERSGNYKGKYHILNGLINPIEDINPEDINIFSLINNRINEKVKEVIIALSPSIEGETTSLYIQKLLEKKNIKISRLSYGIPLGSDIEYLDPLMISKALEDRKYIE